MDADKFNSKEAVRPQRLPESMQDFVPGAWSPSGKLLGGTEVASSMRALSIGALEPATGTYHRSRLPVSTTGYWKFAGWLADSRHFVALGRDQIAIVDVDTGAWRGLLPSHDSIHVALSLSQDASTLLVEAELADGDIWMLESPGAEK